MNRLAFISTSPPASVPRTRGSTRRTAQAVAARINGGGTSLKGAHFPEGPQFRAVYKGETYTAEIKNGAWVDSKGVKRAHQTLLTPSPTTT